MNKKYIVILLALLTVVLAACGQNTQAETTTATEQTTVPQQTTEAPVETTEEVTIPGLEDSIFDEEPVETTQPETTPATNAGSNAGSGTGPDAPDAPDTKPGTSSKPQETKPQETKPQETKPQETKPQETKPQETKPQETTPPSQPRSEYEEFQNMTPSQQQEVMNSYDSLDAFFDWYNNAREEHDAMYPDIEINDGTFDMGELTGN